MFEEAISKAHRWGLQVPGKDNKRPYDRFRGRALFPILNEGGRVVGFGARCLDGSEPKYLNSPETPVYQKGRLVYGLSWAREGIRQAGQVVLMEGYLDVARALEHGVSEVVATCGTALTPAHARLLRRFAPRVVLNFDQDAAGQKAAERSFEALAGEGFDVRVVELPPGHDPDTYLRDHGAEAYPERLGFEEDVDLVGVTGMVLHAPRAYEIAERSRQRGIPVVMGGPHASSRPVEAKEHVDAVVIGEAENIWKGLIEDLKNGCLKPFYKADAFCSMKGFPPPRLDLLRKEAYMTVNCVQTTRGCPYSVIFVMSPIFLERLIAVDLWKKSLKR